MYSIPNHTLGCKCSQCMHANHSVSADPSGSSVVLRPHTKSTDESINEPETTHRTTADRELIRAPSSVHMPTLLHQELVAPTDIIDAAKKPFRPSMGKTQNNAADGFKPTMPQLDWLIEEITSDDDFESVGWSDAKSEADGKTSASNDFTTAPLKMLQEEAKPGVDGKGPSNDPEPITSSKPHPVAAMKAMAGNTIGGYAAATIALKTQKLMAKQDGIPSAAEVKNVAIIPNKESVSNTAFATSFETSKAAVKQSKVTSSSEPKQVGVAPGKAPEPTTAINTSSKTTGAEIKRYNIFSDAQLRESVEQAMRATFPNGLVDAMMADLNGDAALDTETVDERLAALNESDERLSKWKEERAKKDVAKKKAAKAGSVETEAAKTGTVTEQVDELGSEGSRVEDAAKGVVHPSEKHTTPKKPY
ncbi:uncharacterized protein CC84DRAFT_1221555 [Paraphaeosphaeria sporulosa]|uniref:Uncharacterized protein n=1 Tax=Paraphaeosphaeria sporulosa TaxID=1460663 RepID=A0A177C2H0_9PLEO|nr:uncharacterized protein CC84DRAFT_1221555 [Paraphaeosphaeria sporulosa]OAG01008.1 hypothetical protein CC84DRAFT_1221555 [Paraphaeosphaeria sporulosa]